jgi:hypothetical protein
VFCRQRPPELVPHMKQFNFRELRGTMALDGTLVQYVNPTNRQGDSASAIGVWRKPLVSLNIMAGTSIKGSTLARCGKISVSLLCRLRLTCL